MIATSTLTNDEFAKEIASAISEFIENSYDADAEHARVEINTRNVLTNHKFYFDNPISGFIKIQDDGIGMSYEEIQHNWRDLTFSPKRASKASGPTEKGRPYQGGKGTGRQRSVVLGSKIEIITTSKASGESIRAAFDWDQFHGNNSIQEASVFIEKIKAIEKSGTTFFIYPLRSASQWDERVRLEVRDFVNKRVASLVEKKSFNATLVLDGHEFELGWDVSKVDASIVFQNVWQKMSPDLIQEVIAFWNANKMIKPGFSSEERARQVVLILRDANTKAIVGLSTAGVVTFKQLNSNNFYLYRSIILPGYRHPGLTSKVIVETRDLLEAYNKKEGNNFCKGILTFVENPRIQQFRREAVWPASKMAYIGMDKEGRHIRVYYFKGATI